MKQCGSTTSKRTIGVIFFFCLLFTSVRPLHAGLDWVTPITQLSPTVGSSSHDVAVNEHNQAVVVWADNPGGTTWRLRYATYSVGGGWSASQTAHTETDAEYISHPRVLINNSGQVLVTYFYRQQGAG